MESPAETILYVGNVAKSAEIYSQILGTPALQLSEGFALFKPDAGGLLGLWQRDVVDPPATSPGGVELAFAVQDAASVERYHALWSAHGLEIIQAPRQMVFGLTFTARDPDGHRLRVFHPTAG